MQIQRLRRYNLIAGIAHLGQAVAVLVLANGFALPVTASYWGGQPGPSTDRQAHTFFNLSFAGGVAAFFLLSAVAHLLIAGPLWERYQRQLGLKRNPYRWVEYSLSASLMLVLIAMLTGISDLSALLAIAGVNASMIGFGWMQERYEEPGGSLQPFWLGCIAGIIPWVAIGIYLISPGASQHAPGFVYGIYVSIFAFFNVFAAVQWLQYRKVGRFANYLVGERAYITLSLVAKSLLAWQVFSGTLAS